MKLNPKYTQSRLCAELEQAGRPVPDCETYQAILHQVLERSGGTQRATYRQGLRQVEATRRRARRRNGVCTGLGCLAAAACFGLFLSPLGPPGRPDSHFAVIEDETPPLAALPGAQGIRISVVDRDPGTNRLVLSLEDVPDNLDWSSLQGVDREGTSHIPLDADPQSGLVVFALEEDELVLLGNDLEGNALLFHPIN